MSRVYTRREGVTLAYDQPISPCRPSLSRTSSRWPIRPAPYPLVVSRPCYRHCPGSHSADVGDRSHDVRLWEFRFLVMAAPTIRYSDGLCR